MIHRPNETVDQGAFFFLTYKHPCKLPMQPPPDTRILASTSFRLIAFTQRSNRLLGFTTFHAVERGIRSSLLAQLVDWHFCGLRANDVCDWGSTFSAAVLCFSLYADTVSQRIAALPTFFSAGKLGTLHKTRVERSWHTRLYTWGCHYDMHWFKKKRLNFLNLLYETVHTRSRLHCVLSALYFWNGDILL